jgi:hypothetical protein
MGNSRPGQGNEKERMRMVSGTRTNGDHTYVWVRATVGFRKIDGKWMVTHEHLSVPFDMETYKASLDLKP